MIIVDTTVLVYAVGDDHELREPCRALVAAVEAGDLTATTTVEVIQEFAHVRARHRSRADAATLARSYAALFSPLLVVEAPDLLAGLTLFETSGGLGPFDAVLAAVAVRRGARGLVSADAGFTGIRGVHHLDPAAPGFSASLLPDP